MKGPPGFPKTNKGFGHDSANPHRWPSTNGGSMSRWAAFSVASDRDVGVLMRRSPTSVPVSGRMLRQAWGRWGDHTGRHALAADLQDESGSRQVSRIPHGYAVFKGDGHFSQDLLA